MRQAPRVVSEQQPADRYQGAGEPASAGGTEPVAIPNTKPTRAERAHCSSSAWWFMGTITDVKPLANLRELRYLDLTQNQIEDLRPWQSNQARITDAQPKPHHGFVSVSEFKILRVLSLQNASREPASADGAGAVERIESRQQQDRGLDGLEAMKALRTLHLTGNQIADLQPLFKLVGLRELELVHNGQLHYPEVAQLQEVLPRTQINHNATQTEISLSIKPVNRSWCAGWILAGSCKPIRTICGRRKGTRRIPMWDTSGCCSIRRQRARSHFRHR